MSVSINVQWDKWGIAGLETGPLKRTVVRALRKADATALRDIARRGLEADPDRKWFASKYIAPALTGARPSRPPLRASRPRHDPAAHRISRPRR